MGKEEPSFTIGENANWCSYCEISIENSQITKQKSTKSSSCTIPCLIPKAFNIELHKYMLRNFHSHHIHNSQKMTYSRWMDNENSFHIHKRILFIYKTSLLVVWIIQIITKKFLIFFFIKMKFSKITHTKIQISIISFSISFMI